MASEIVKGSDQRIFIHAEDNTDPLNIVNYDIDVLPAFEVWVYTNRASVRKFCKAPLKEGYSGIIERDDALNYHIDFLGSINKTMADGVLLFDFLVGTSDAALTIFKNMESKNSGIKLITKEITSWQ